MPGSPALNYLAHLYLAPREPAALVGNLLGDFVRGRDLDGYPPPVQSGIRLHRRIDAFTDSHPVHRASRRRIGPANRRYAGILVDVFYDHFLARDWERYHPQPLAVFTRQVYAVLQEHEPLLPPRLRDALPRMVADDWLGCYATVAGIRLTLARVARRLSRPGGLVAGGDDLEEGYPELQADFRSFFPDVVAFARTESAA